MIEKCNTCKHWDQTPRVNGRWKAMSIPGYGICNQPKIKPGEDFEKDFTGASDMLVSSDSEGEYEPIIRTGMNFGCIHHENKNVVLKND